MNYNFMKGGMQFADNTDPVSDYISLYGNSNGNKQKKLQYKKKEVRTHSKLKGGNHLYFNLYNIESFNEYENETFDLSTIIDKNKIEHLYLCGFLTKWTRKELFIKKGKTGEGNNEDNKNAHFKDIGKILYELCQKIKNDHEERTNKIQIILAHSTEKNALCIIFNMSNIDESYYDSLKKSLPDTSFSDDKILEGKIKQSQLENLIEFTNEKLIIKPKADFTVGLMWKDTGVLLPASGTELENDELSKALAEKVQFTQEELKSFGIESIKKDNYVKVGDNYFKPLYSEKATTNDYEYIENDLKQEISYKNLKIKLEQKIIAKVFADSKINGEAEYESLVDNITKLDSILKLIVFFTKLKKELGDGKGYELDTKKAYVNKSLNLLYSLRNNIEAEIPKSKTRFLLSLLFGNATVEATADEQNTVTVDKPEQDIRAFTSPETTKRVLEVENKLKAKLSYDALKNNFSSEQIEKALEAADISVETYKTLIGKIGIEEKLSVGGGKKNKLIRGGALTTDENEKVKTVLKSLQNADKGENTKYFAETQEMLLQYERMVSTTTQATTQAAAAGDVETEAEAEEQVHPPNQSTTPPSPSQQVEPLAQKTQSSESSESNRLKLKTRFLLKLLFSRVNEDKLTTVEAAAVEKVNQEDAVAPPPALEEQKEKLGDVAKIAEETAAADEVEAGAAKAAAEAPAADTPSAEETADPSAESKAPSEESKAPAADTPSASAESKASASAAEAPAVSGTAAKAAVGLGSAAEAPAADTPSASAESKASASAAEAPAVSGTAAKAAAPPPAAAPAAVVVTEKYNNRRARRQAKRQESTGIYRREQERLRAEKAEKIEAKKVEAKKVEAEKIEAKKVAAEFKDINPIIYKIAILKNIFNEQPAAAEQAATAAVAAAAEQAAAAAEQEAATAKQAAKQSADNAQNSKKKADNLNLAAKNKSKSPGVGVKGVKIAHEAEAAATAATAAAEAATAAAEAAAVAATAAATAAAEAATATAAAKAAAPVVLVAATAAAAAAAVVQVAAAAAAAPPPVVLAAELAKAESAKAKEKAVEAKKAEADAEAKAVEASNAVDEINDLLYKK